ncbi:RNA-directed DNA polymerase, eukaryota, partial [Tanacetum coccineum]
MGIDNRFSYNTKEDQTQKIFKSVFVTNFPDHFTARHLWNVCLAYGNVIDFYIPFKKSKAGKKFAFVRFIRVDNLERLIENLCTIWIGRFHLHANVVRFQRESNFNASQPNSAKPKSFTSMRAVKNSFAAVLKSSNTNPNSSTDFSPAIVLDDSCITERDFSSSLMGKIKDINAMSNLYFILANKGFENVKLSYLGGLPIKAYTRNTFAKIVSPWGEFTDVEDNENSSLSFIIVKGQIYWIRVKELEAWCPEFNAVKEDISSSDEESDGDFKVNKSGNFDLDNEDEIDHVSDSSFTPIVVEDNVIEINSEKNSESKNILASNNEGASSDQIGNSSISKFKASGLILGSFGNKAKKGWIQELNTKHRINFVAIQETKMEKIDLFSIKALWGNFCFDYVLCPSIGYSGGILCVWDPRFFVKDNSTIYDLFLVVSVTWVPTSTKLRINSVYAPQNLSDRKMLWDYIHHLIDSWDGECVILGDFNEVRFEQEMYGTAFNLHGANAFNNFITMTGLVDLPLEGYSFTWSHKFASKMSKLDRFLITEGLLSLFPSISALWFDKLVENSWKKAACTESNAIIKLKRKLQALKSSIKQWVKDDKINANAAKLLIRARLLDLDKTIDQGRGTNEIANDRSKLLKELHDLNTSTSFDLAQKAKICWAIEGDENSKYFHGIINKKRSQMAIRGVLVEGDWYVKPSIVKKEFLNHFSNRFSAPVSPKITLQAQFPKCLSLEQIDVLERTVTYDDIKILAIILNAGLYKGIHIDDSLSLSHLLYVDNVVFVVATTASSIRCATFTSPFNYLVVKVGGKMSRLSSWDEVIVKISSRFSKWKLKTLSVGGRYTLIKSVLSSLPLYYFSIFKVPKGILNKMEAFRRNFFNGADIADRKMSLIGWKKILALKKNEGLGISSLFALNCALFLKWVWRFISNGSSLWSRFIKAIYGVRGAINIVHSSSRSSPWLDIIREFKTLSITSTDLFSLVKKVGNGDETFFWNDVWIADFSLKHLFLRLYSLELDKLCSVVVEVRDSSLVSSFRRPPRGGIEEDQLRLLGDIISSIGLSYSNDRWIWRLDSSGDFSVKLSHCSIDDSFLPKEEVS